MLFVFKMVLSTSPLRQPGLFRFLRPGYVKQGGGSSSMMSENFDWVRLSFLVLWLRSEWTLRGMVVQVATFWKYNLCNISSKIDWWLDWILIWLWWSINCYMIKKGKYGKIKLIQFAFRISLVQCLAWAGHITPDTWHLTGDTWHITPDMWRLVEGEHSVKVTRLLIEQPRLHRVC